MTSQDLFGCPIALGSVENSESAVQEWNQLCLAFLAHGSATPTHLGNLMAQAPDCAIAYAAKGFFMLLLGRAELLADARSSLKTASEKLKYLEGAPKRETDFISALTAALNGKMYEAAAKLEAVTDYAPQDVMAFKLAHAIRFMLGDKVGMATESHRALNRVDATNPASGYIFGCHAFALEEMGDYADAERHGKEALMKCPDDAWGLHAVAHVYDMTAQADTGIKWLESRPNSWTHCNNFSFHVWWHLALFYLDKGDYEKVLALYDKDIRAEHTDDYRDISNATSLLARLEGVGVDVGNRWEELIALSKKRASDNCVVFADLHYLLALGRSNSISEIDKIVKAMGEKAAHSEADIDIARSTAGMPATLGIKAFYEGDYETAYRQLGAARSHMQTIGGSHAQRDVFERLTIDAAIQAGHYQEARALIEDRNWYRSVADGYAKSRLACVNAGTFTPDLRIGAAPMSALSA